MLACIMHSSAHAFIIVIVAVIMAIMLALCIPLGRIIMCIIVPAMSAQFMHMLRHIIMSSPIMASAHIMHACSAAEQASIHSCIIVMPVAPMGMFLACISIICIVIESIVVLHPGSPSTDRRQHFSAAIQSTPSYAAGHGLSPGRQVTGTAARHLS